MGGGKRQKISSDSEEYIDVGEDQRSGYGGEGSDCGDNRAEPSTQVSWLDTVPQISNMKQLLVDLQSTRLGSILRPQAEQHTLAYVFEDLPMVHRTRSKLMTQGQQLEARAGRAQS